jgi:hypothetical protein
MNVRSEHSKKNYQDAKKNTTRKFVWVSIKEFFFNFFFHNIFFSPSDGKFAIILLQIDLTIVGNLISPDGKQCTIP